MTSGGTGIQAGRVGIADELSWLEGDVRRHVHLIGVSGGADSTALLHILLDAGVSNLVVCHLDHQLRGSASTEDAKFVARMAERLGLRCEVGREDVNAAMACNGESMETAARHARHRFFAACVRKYDCPRMLLAHHADDQAETILWNLMRGSYGLKGMRAEQRFVVEETEVLLIRPLLGIRRAVLVDWLRERGIRWREDASNAEPIAVRNRLRQEVMPLLNEVTGRDSAAALLRAAADFAELEEHGMQSLAQSSLLDPQGRLHVPAMRKLAPVMQRAALRGFLTHGGVTSLDRRLLDAAVALLDTKSAAVLNLPGGRYLRRREGRLWIAD